MDAIELTAVLVRRDLAELVLIIRARDAPTRDVRLRLLLGVV